MSILKLLALEGRMSAATVREVLMLAPVEADKALTKLAEDGLIECEGDTCTLTRTGLRWAMRG